MISGDQVGDQVWDQVEAQVGDQVRAQVFGAHDAGWLSWISFFYEAVGLECCAPARGLMALAQTCGWWAPYRDACIIQHRHTHVYFDDLKRLHRDDGPAVLYRDGFSVFSLHGVRVPERVVLAPETITLAEISAETNAEVRRIMIERYGPGKYLQESGAKLLDMDSLTLEGSACRALMEDSAGDRWLVGTDGSTKRVYHMPVPAEAQTCSEAHAMIAGFPENRLLAES